MDYDSTSEDGPPCIFLSNLVKKWQSYRHFCWRKSQKINFLPTVPKKSKFPGYLVERGFLMVGPASYVKISEIAEKDRTVYRVTQWRKSWSMRTEETKKWAAAPLFYESESLQEKNYRGALVSRLLLILPLLLLSGPLLLKNHLDSAIAWRKTCIFSSPENLHYFILIYRM